MKVEDIVSDSEIDTAWGNANFGSPTRRDIVRYSLLKKASGYHTGHTAKLILQDLGLTTAKDSLTKKGREYLYAAFYNGTNI